MIHHVVVFQQSLADAEVVLLDLLLGALDGTVLVTADHGNADQMTETKKGKTSVRTAHSLNPVPFIIYDPDSPRPMKHSHSSP